MNAPHLQPGPTALPWTPTRRSGGRAWGGRPLYCFAGAAGGAGYLRPLAEALHSTVPVELIQAPGLVGEEQALDRVEDLAQHAAARIRAVQPAGPYAVAGHSFGGLLAYETASRLHAAGHDAAVLLIDSSLADPDRTGRTGRTDASTLLQELAELVSHLFAAAAAPVPGSEWEYLIRTLRRAGYPDAEQDARRMLTVYAASRRALHAYRPSRAPLPVRLLRAVELPPAWRDFRYAMGLLDPREWRQSMDWASWSVQAVPGDHLSMLRPPHVDRLADAVAAWLADLPATMPPPTRRHVEDRMRTVGVARYLPRRAA